MNIILVDANTYEKEIESELARLKDDYYRVKFLVRNKLLGKHVMPKKRTYSIGLLRIATILVQNHYNVKYVHFYNLEYFLSHEEFYPDIIAFSAVCPTIPLCSKFVQLNRKKYSNVKFVLGGAQLNAAPELTKRLFGNFDIYSVGYDVEAAEQIVSAKLIKPVCEYVDFSLLPYEISEYAINTCSTLGCPYTCNYCQDRLIPYKQISENGFIPFFMKKLPSKTCVHFFDSVLGGGEKRILQICKNISETNHSFLLSCDIRAELINEKTIDALVSAGFVEVRIGLESADDELLRHNNRYLTLNNVLNKIQLIRKRSNIYITLYSAIGFPGTTKESIRLTKELFFDLLRSRAVDEIKNCIFVPYPLDFQRFLLEDIEIIDENWENYDRQSKPVYNLSNIKSHELWEEYLDLTNLIVKGWMNGFKITKSDIDSAPKYSEYIIKSYNI